MVQSPSKELLVLSAGLEPAATLKKVGFSTVERHGVRIKRAELCGTGSGVIEVLEQCDFYTHGCTGTTLRPRKSNQEWLQEFRETFGG